MSTMPKLGRIHAGTLAGSARLRRLHQYLLDGKWHSTLDIARECNILAVNTAVAELRANGIGILCDCVGKGRYEYCLSV